MKNLNGNDIKKFGLILSIQAEIEAMKIENIKRISLSEVPAYCGDDFQTKAQELTNLCYCPDEHL